jgi:hypothetical protein
VSIKYLDIRDAMGEGANTAGVGLAAVSMWYLVAASVERNSWRACPGPKVADKAASVSVC